MTHSPPPEKTGPDDKAILKAKRATLNRTALCSMATINNDGTPHINTAFFCGDGGEIFFLSDKRSMHCRNIEKRPRIAIAVFDSHQNWDADKAGMQIYGEAYECDDTSSISAQKLYAKRFPKYASYVKSQKGKSDPHYKFFVVHIHRFTILDEKRFGEETYISSSD